jgi:hypothetical protein
MLRPPPRGQQRPQPTQFQHGRQLLGREPGGAGAVGSGKHRLEQADLQQEAAQPLLLGNPAALIEVLADHHRVVLGRLVGPAVRALVLHIEAPQAVVDLDWVDEPVLAAADGGMGAAQDKQLPQQRRDRRGLGR